MTAIKPAIKTALLPLRSDGDWLADYSYDVGLVALTQEHVETLLRLRDTFGTVLWLVEKALMPHNAGLQTMGFHLSFLDYSCAPYGIEDIDHLLDDDLEAPLVVPGEPEWELQRNDVFPSPTECDRVTITPEGLTWSFYPKHSDALITTDTLVWALVEDMPPQAAKP